MPTDDPSQSPTLLMCSRCGAAIGRDRREQHSEFHRQLDKLIEAGK